MLSGNDLPRLGPLRLPEDSVGAALVRRIALAVGIIAASAIFLWFDRDGLRDNAHPDEIPNFVDVLYFTVVSLTTVGYGDIAPITEQARLVNALLLTPIRIFLWVLFLGTAYEVSVLRLRYRQERQMRELRERLEHHIVVCGYGAKGRAIVNELLAHDHRPDEIVVIDTNEDALSGAAKRGLVALRGDASTEAILRSAAVDKAGYVMVAPHRDDAAVLICLTVRNLAPKTVLVAAAREVENVKLLYGAGANLVVAPSVSGGRLMASAVHQTAVPHFLEDILMFGGGLSLTERTVTPAETGRLVSDLPDLGDTLVLGIARGHDRIPFHALGNVRLQAGDVLVLVTGDQVHAHAANSD